MPLSQFQGVTSGEGLARRAMIRHLKYHIVVLFDILDWQTRKEKGYALENHIRHNDDAAFQSAIIDLFNILTDWDLNLRLSVELALLGREVGEEPHTYDFDIAGDYRYDFKKGRTKAVPVYRAKFLENGASLLPDVPCIDHFCFAISSHHIWAGSAMQIIQRCTTVTKLVLGLDEYIRPDHIEYIQARRQDGEPWKEMMPGLNVLLSDNGCLSQNFRHLSLSLGELKIHQLSLAPDFYMRRVTPYQLRNLFTGLD
ncbi:uncharacterized protein N7496_012566 [Penicillium cataractarum]|uniref:Uncharacterized protein n=1 Tax=Penicillium cataractarum TaxID=2100454 RepID=A0A9W9RAQ6_9EURO|nr:uncharacterized protein N7496_012566 [Penicillium cataractarum]KAJ5355354.1 hypothetical protein N7496_012566 [Penicillium cataractarum]